MKIPAKGFTHGGKFHADDVFSTVGKAFCKSCALTFR